MPDPTTVNAQIVDTLQVLQTATLSPEIIKASGAGKAFQSVSQSAAIAVQDAADNLRNLSAIGATAVGVAMAQYIESGSSDSKDAIAQAQNIVTQAVSDFQKIGSAAAVIVNSFASSIASS